MKKQKRYFTIMIVPHTEESTYSLKLPLSVVQLMVALAVVILAALLILAYSYRNALYDAKEVQVLRQVNQVQQGEINNFAIETQRLIEQMQQIEILSDLVAEKLGISLGNNESDDNEANIVPEDGETDTSVYIDTERDQSRLYAGRSGGGGVLNRAVANMETLQSFIPEQADSLEILEEEVTEFVQRLAATPSIWPANGRFTSGFGMRRSPFNRAVMQFHRGIDIAGAHGSAIYATADGTVTFAGYRGAYGRLIIINHGYGYETYYAHLSRLSVSNGQRVERGQVIGRMGRTGRVTGTHLHYEVRVNGVAVNPINFIS